MEKNEAESDDSANYYRSIGGAQMRQAIELAEKLNMQIKNSREYQHYVETDRRLRDNRELHERFDEFRRRNYELQFSEGDSNLYDEVFNLVKEYDTILQDSIVNDFVLAEQRLCSLMRELYGTLSDGLELDYDYLEK